MKSTLIKPETCEECPFFEHARSPYGTHYKCRYYNKSSYSTEEKRFPYCKVDCIIVTEKA